MVEVQPILLGVLALSAIGLCVGLLAGPTRPRRVAALAVGLSSLLVPLSLPSESVLARGLCALWTIMIVLRSIDLATERRTTSLPLRIALMFVAFDIRAARRCPPEVQPRALGVGMLLALVGIAALVGAIVLLPQLGTPWHYPLRWLAGAVFVYATADAANFLVTAGYRGLGWKIPPQHDHPILSRSVAEFWSKRWNINVHAWLMRHAFRPFAARGRPVLGLCFAFFVSALLHWWLIYAALGFTWALPMGAFFLLQGLLVLAERAARINRLSPALQRAWTVGWMLLTTPLFVEPFLRLVPMSS